MGFEPTTNGLEDRDSTTELIPQIGAIDGTRTRDLSRDKGISYQLNDNRIVFWSVKRESNPHLNIGNVLFYH